MSYRRNGLKVLGTSLVAVLGLMAFMAVSAQATWKVAGAALKANEAVKVSAHTEGNLLVPAQNLQILCSVVEAENLNLLAAAPTEKAEGGLKFKTCKTWQAGKESPGCKPIEPIVAGGSALLILHNSLTYVLFSPPAGGIFSIVSFNPAKCALAEENEITGSLVAECVSSALKVGAKLCEAEAVTHYLQQAPEALFPSDVLFFGANKAFIHGIAAAVLNGANLGKEWSGIVYRSIQ